MAKKGAHRNEKESNVSWKFGCHKIGLVLFPSPCCCCCLLFCLQSLTKSFITIMLFRSTLVLALAAVVAAKERFNEIKVRIE